MIEQIKNWEEVGSPDIIATRLNELIASHNELEQEVDILHKSHLVLIEAMAKLITK